MPKPTLTVYQYLRNSEPSPTAVALVASISAEDWSDVNYMAAVVDAVAEEARTNERKRIFQMSFSELFREFWKGRKLYAK